MLLLCIFVCIAAAVLITAANLILINLHSEKISSGDLIIAEDGADGSRYLFMEFKDDVGKLKNGEFVKFRVRRISQK